MSIPQITLLVPTFNRPKLLERAIASILEQSWTDFIIRVHDNGSDQETDNLMRRLLAEDDRIEYFRHQENIGLLRNFNSLIQSVDTPFYALISDDDLLLPGHVESGIKALTENPQAFFYSSATLTADLTKGVLELRNQDWTDGVYQPSSDVTRSVIGEHFTSTGTIFRRSLIPLLNGFHAIGADDILSIILTGCYPFYASPKPGAVFTISERHWVYHGVSFTTLDQILVAGAADRKFVIEHSASGTTGLLLEFLEVRYSGLLEAKAIQLRRSGLWGTERQSGYSYKILRQCLVRRSTYGLLRIYLPERLLKYFASIKQFIKSLINSSSFGSRPSVKFEQTEICDYLKGSSSLGREKFLVACQKLRQH